MEFRVKSSDSNNNVNIIKPVIAFGNNKSFIIYYPNLYIERCFPIITS